MAWWEKEKAPQKKPPKTFKKTFFATLYRRTHPPPDGSGTPTLDPDQVLMGRDDVPHVHDMCLFSLDF